MFQTYNHPENAVIPTKYYKYAFNDFLNDPNSFKHLIFYENDQFYVLYDGFPKSKVHLLIIQKRDIKKYISDLKD